MVHVIQKLYNLICEKNYTTKSSLPSNHDVAQKQIINPNSPLQDEQLKFIDEGGDSQPLDNHLK